MSVRYRARALEDVHAITLWRNRQSPDVAEKIEAAIPKAKIEAVFKIGTFPFIAFEH